MSENETPIRFIRANGGKTYLRLEDVVEYLREMAAVEETDTRNRFLEAADKMLNSFSHPKG